MAEGIPADSMQVDSLDRSIERLERAINQRARQEDRLEVTRQRLDQATRVSDSTGNLARSLTRTGLSTLGLGGLGYTAYENRRRLGQYAQGVFRAQALNAGGLGAVAGQQGVLGRAAGLALKAIPIVRLIAVVGGLSVVIRMLTSSTDKNTAATAESTRSTRYWSAQWQSAISTQTAALGQLGQQMRTSSESFQELTDSLAMRRDPLGRTFGETQERMQAVGSAATATQLNNIVRLADAENRLYEQREATARNMAAFAAPYRQMGREVQTFLESVRTAAGAGFTDPAAVGRQTGLPRTAAALGGIGGRTALSGFLTGMFGPTAGQMGLLGFGAAEGAFGGRGPLGGELERQLFGLQVRGPGAVLGAAATVRAGGEEEYALRVEREARQLRDRQTEVWQQQVLEVLRALEREDPSRYRDARFQAEVRFGERQIEGVD